MDKRHLSDEELIQMLQQMPSIKDERPQEVIYKRLQEELHKSDREQRQKRRSIPFWPMVATAAAIFLVFILGSSLLNQNNFLTMDQSSQQESMDSSENAEILQKEPELMEGLPEDSAEVEIHNFSERNEEESIIETEPPLSALYPGQIGESDLFVTIGIPDLLVQNVIPITVILPIDPEKTWVDRYNDVMKQINETELGLADYYPYNGTLSLDEFGNLTLNLDAGITSNWGSTGENVFFESLNMFRFQNVPQIYLYENGQPGIQTQMFGDPLEVYSIPPHQRTGYMIYETNNRTYLAPTYESFDSIKTAFEVMKTEIATHELSPSIPEKIEFTVLENNDELIVQFNNDTELESDETTIYMLESILLTAKEFGFTSVKFENTGIDSISGLDLNSSISVPIAPNHIDIDIEA